MIGRKRIGLSSLLSPERLRRTKRNDHESKRGRRKNGVSGEWQGIMILVFASIADWVSLPIGLALVTFMGVMRLQESVTDWCPSDLFLRSLGLEKKFGNETILMGRDFL